MHSKLEKYLENFIIVGPSDNKKKWAEGLMFVIVILVSLVLVIYSWTHRSDPSFDEKGLVALLGIAGAFALVMLLFYFIILTIKLIYAGICALIQYIVIDPAKNTWRFITSFLINSWLVKQFIKIGRFWFNWWQYIGFEVGIKPFLSYLEPEIEPPLSDVTELTQLHLNEKYENQEFIEQIIERYQRLAMLLVLPLGIGWLVVPILPLFILPLIAKVSPHLSGILFFMWVLIWIPASVTGFKAFISAHDRRQDTWRIPLWELMKQEYINKMAETANLQAQSTVEERLDALRLTYQQELTRYQQLEQDSHKVEASLDWLNHIPHEDKPSAVLALELILESQNNSFQEGMINRERTQFPRRTAYDFGINVLAGLFGAFLLYIYQLF